MIHTRFIVALLGLLIAQFEYSLFGFAATIIAIKFFSDSHPVVALIQTFGLFAIGYSSKILGVVFLATIGDRRGRSYAFRVSMLGIAIPTILIGILPTYQTWGYISILLLLACRLLQGIFIAGEHDGVSIYILEQVDSKKACLANSLIGVCYNLGLYLSALSVEITYRFEEDWCWRIPFLVSGLMTFIILIFRQHLTESNIFRKRLKSSDDKLWPVLSQNKRACVMAFFIFASIGSIYYFYLIFWHTYLCQTLKIISLIDASFYTSLLLLIHVLSKPIIGLLGDQLGTQRTMILGCGLILLNNAYQWYLLQISQAPNWFSLSLLALGLSCITVPAYVYLINFFPVEHRYRSLSITHVMASSTLSCLVPMISMSLWYFTQQSWAPLTYLSIFPIIIILVICFNLSDHIVQ